jgi:hypothetical protein
MALEDTLTKKMSKKEELRRLWQLYELALKSYERSKDQKAGHNTRAKEKPK